MQELVSNDPRNLGLGSPEPIPRAATRSSTLRVETPCTHASIITAYST